MASGMSLEASVHPVVCALSPTVMVSVYALGFHLPFQEDNQF